MGERLVRDRPHVIEKMIPFYPCDLAVVNPRGRVLCWLEVKCRTTPRSQYPTVILQLTKVMQIERLVAISGIPAKLAVQWTDQIGVLNLPAPIDHVSIAKGAAKNRGGPDDAEALAHFRTDLFSTFCEGDVRRPVEKRTP